MPRKVYKDHQITQEDISVHNLFSYSKKYHRDGQLIINTLCKDYDSYIDSLHEMYKGRVKHLILELVHEKETSDSLRVAISVHNQKMLGNRSIDD